MRHIVCGWYTPDYEGWAGGLKSNLRMLGESFDIVEAPKLPGGWERNAIRKPAQVMDAMERNPGATIVFLDVDCEVNDRLDRLASIRGDFAAHMRFRRRFKVRSGTMVFSPTPRARALVETWCDLSSRAPLGTMDQETLAQALFCIPGLAVENLPVTYCAVPSDGVDDPIIRHSFAHLDHSLMSAPRRWLNRVIGARNGGHNGRFHGADG